MEYIEMNTYMKYYQKVRNKYDAGKSRMISVSVSTLTTGRGKANRNENNS